MKVKQKQGMILIGTLKGVPAVLVRKGTTGVTVRLLEARGAYAAGETVVLGWGEFKLDG